MKMFLLLLSLAVIGLTGCVSKKTAQLEAQTAFLAGQQQQSAPTAPTIVVLGDVKYHVIPWHEGMTLADALLAADYQGLWDPRAVVIARQDQRVTVKVRDLLHKRDNPPLLPGDRLEVQR